MKQTLLEGDNLEVLNVLERSYAGQIKMIYIDPPYNTGNDFIYNDKYADGIETYLEYTGQKDDKGNDKSTKKETSGSSHSNWLSMMYPRLEYAKRLLSDDGVIFISIDDNEQANLKKLCDLVFGESNFVACFPWRKRTAKSDVPHGVSQDYEYILLYAFGTSKFAIDKETRKYYETPDFPNEPWRTHDLTKQCTATERPNSFFTIKNPKNGIEYPANPNRVWCITSGTITEYMNKNRIVFPGDYDFLKIKQPVLRYWKTDDMKKSGDDFGAVSISTLLPNEVGLTGDGTKDMKSLFDDIVFPFPKPVSLLKYIIGLYRNSQYYILDFFSGSGTTAHAVMQLNAEDCDNRKFIMVQLPEIKPEAIKAGFKNIAEIGKERIRRAGKRIKEEHPDTNIDIGFKVFKLDSKLSDKPFRL